MTVPLHGGMETNLTWALTNLILAILGLVLAFIAGALAWARRQRRKEEVQEHKLREDEHAWAYQQAAYGQTAYQQSTAYQQTPYGQEYNPEEDLEEERKHQYRRRLAFIIATIVLGVAGVILFLLTEDISKFMVLVDFWTIVNGVILILEIVGFILAFRHKRKLKDDDEETPATPYYGDPRPFTPGREPANVTAAGSSQ